MKKQMTAETSSSSPSLAQDTNHDTRRHELIVAAFQLIAEKGFEGLRIREVAARVAINIGTLYYYFPTKEGLIQGVVDYLVQHIVTIQAPAALQEVKTPRDELHQHFCNLVYELRETPDVFRVLGELLLRANRDTTISPILQETDENWSHYLVSLLTRGIKDGLFRADLDPQITARTLMSFFKGIPLQLGIQTSEVEKAVDQLENWLLA